MLRVLGLVGAFLLAGSATLGQQSGGTGQSGVLIIDSEQLYLESQYGRAIRAALEEAARALQAENDRIEAQLIEEERDLAARRPDMTVEAFRAEAADFDAKVQDIRRARDAKITELEQAQIAGREQFYDDVRGVVGRLMLDRGAVVLLDRRSVFLALGSADVTAEAIRRIDTELLRGQTGGETQEAEPDGLIAPETDAPEQEGPTATDP